MTTVRISSNFQPDVIPAIIADSGKSALLSFIDFFSKRLDTLEEQQVYYLISLDFFSWCQEHKKVSLKHIVVSDVLKYSGFLLKTFNPEIVKKRVELLKNIFNYFLEMDLININPFLNGQSQQNGYVRTKASEQKHVSSTTNHAYSNGLEHAGNGVATMLDSLVATNGDNHKSTKVKISQIEICSDTANKIDMLLDSLKGHCPSSQNHLTRSTAVKIAVDFFLENMKASGLAENEN